MQFEYSQALHIDACVLLDEWLQFCSQLLHKLLNDFEKFDLFKFVILNHEKMWKPSYNLAFKYISDSLFSNHSLDKCNFVLMQKIKFNKIRKSFLLFDKSSTILENYIVKSLVSIS